ncbi:DNA primase [Helicobacter felis]|uniref:DNA primase n=1 Tax=Helicobacter felis TaxID=214 RepID=UPI001F27B2E6|nr:DNA primase [Helicobacter felis]
MSSMVKQEDLAQLREVVSIVDVVGSYIDLKRAGANYMAICPFHNERTPSFVINPARNTFKCFGCGKSGDSIAFVMAYDSLEFQDAVAKLAQRYGLALDMHAPAQEKEQDTGIALLERIARCYQDILARTPHALEYLKGRGLSGDSIAEFRLGYCDSAQVLDYIEKHSLDKQTLHDLGVLGRSEKRKEYATLFGRVIFPIQNANGKIVGFGGRALQSGQPKYINSPAHRLFEKSKILYGYPQARPHIVREQKMILTEGYLDVILAHQAGLKCAVATLGTALTRGHLPLLRVLKPCSPIIMAYDADNAGQSATLRAVELLCSDLRYGGVVELEKGLDLADMVAQNKVPQLKSALNTPVPFIEYALRRVASSYDLLNPLDKRQAREACFKALEGLSQDADILDFYYGWLKEEYGFKGAPKVQQEESTQKKTKQETRRRNEEELLYSLLLFPELLECARPFVEPKYFKHPQNAQTYQDILEGRLNTPHQNALSTDKFLDNTMRFWKEHGRVQECFKEAILHLGKTYWVDFWRAQGHAESSQGLDFSSFIYADLIQQCATLESLPLMCIKPS